MHKQPRQLLIALIGIVLIGGYLSERVDASDELESQYREQASKILDALRADNISTVGVLKFSVRIGDGPFPGNVGTLNTRLVEKLELALALANPARKTDEHKQVGVVRGASDIAATIDGATHLSAGGRNLLFSKPYPLAWKHRDKTDVVPDAFIVGVVQIESDLSSMQIELMLLKKSASTLTPLATLTVPTDLEDLIDSGESFTTRGIFDGGRVEEDKAKTEEVVRKKALLVRTETLGESTPQRSTQHPFSSSSDAPIKFEVWYDNNLQNYEFRDGAAFVKEPQEGQQVILAVRRKGSDRNRYGIIVRVNGENTLYRERIPDAKASLWILEPNLTEFSIRGFQIDGGQRQQFRVLSDTDSESRKFDYGRDIGMISVSVYEEQTGTPAQLSDDELDLAVQSQAQLPDETTESRGQLGSSLFDQLLAQDTTRGLISEGANEAAKIDTVQFTPKSTPVMAASVRYYKPAE